ncbi:MAG: hypothetical protein M1824_003456 [Vezdaea acicularis]|nr:MAG: hypothetical protein M1824_003456 [Vezdaea acicularis]
MSTADDDLSNTYNPIYNLIRARPVFVTHHETGPLFLAPPFLGPLLFPNADSDARDHCANERTFLSWLRLSLYMAIVAVAIVISFHIKNEPTKVERKTAYPVGLVFGALALACLGSGVAGYVRTVQRYGERRAMVQSGWKTQVVFTVVAAVIVAACVLFLSTNARQAR